MSLRDKLLKIATKSNSYADTVANSKAGEVDVVCSTDVPMFNVALGGTLNSGIQPGILQIVGDSRTFKTNYSLLIVSSYMRKYEDAVCLFFDSEFGASKEYFSAFDIDPNRVIHIPIENIEELKHQISIQLTAIKEDIDASKGKEEPHVIIFVDSLGMLPSKKEADDAEEGKVVADMTRARAMNSLFRIITVPLKLYKIPFIAINHYYDTMEMYSKKIIKGGKGGFLASDDIWIISRSQVKEDGELQGWNFNITVEKSRTVKERAVIPITVTYDNGIDRTSGLLEVARATGFVVSPKNGWYQRTGIDDNEGKEKSHRKSAMTWDWWKPVLDNPDFQDAVEKMYCLKSGGSMIFKNDEMMKQIGVETEESSKEN